MSRTAIDMIGQRFGRAVVISRAANRHKRATWNCRCDCGAKFVTAGGELRRGHTRSCGCLHSELSSARFSMVSDWATSHGHAARGRQSPTYRSWYAMKQRCGNSKNKKYHLYGGRGISVCSRWLRSFENFLHDMGERPRGKTIDRVDVNGNYEPGNCRWADSKTQRANIRKH